MAKKAKTPKKKLSPEERAARRDLHERAKLERLEAQAEELREESEIRSLYGPKAVSLYRRVRAHQREAQRLCVKLGEMGYQVRD